ncbi:hypothetical protein ACU4GG_31125 [Streptomyces nojiriensis]
MPIREDDVQLAARAGGDLVGGVLHELEQLALAVSALGDATFAVRVFLDQPRIDLVRLQHHRGLAQDGGDHGESEGSANCRSVMEHLSREEDPNR